MSINFYKKNNLNKKGFTLIEIMVSVTVFAIVIVLCLGSIISAFDANRKSKSLRSVMDNLNLTLESMTRTIRFGTIYHCGTSLPLNTPVDCSSANTAISVRDADGRQVSYYLDNSRIMRSVDGVNSYAVTSPDVVVTRLAFRVYGSQPFVTGSTNCNAPNNCLQPFVIIVITGYVGEVETRSTFSLQTSVSQRLIDFQ